ncbi:MAG: type II toxin-antitoxin system HipA family toxin, partial [Vicinamibacteria bacterium]
IEPQGLVLSPAYDMNPNPERSELSLAIDEVNATCDVEVALKAAPDYGLAITQAAEIVREVREAVAGWREEATKLDISREEQERLRGAFR